MTLNFTPLPGDDICRNNHGGDPYSEAANPQPSKKLRDAARIYAWLMARGEQGGTSEEAGLALGLCQNTYTARYADMKEAGDLVSAGKCRKTTSGRDAGVWLARGVVEARKLKQARLL